MWATGQPDDPPYWNTAGPADIMGSIMLAFGVVAAIAAREQLGGSGQKVELSHLSATMFLQYWSIGTLLLTGASDWPRLDRRSVGNPLWNHYRCADGEWIAIALLQPDRHWRDFCTTTALQHLVDDPRFCDAEQRRIHSRELIEILDKVFAAKPPLEWERLLSENPDFVYDRVQRLADLPSDPQIIANEYLTDFEHPALGTVKALNFPTKLSRTPARIYSAAPQLGEHTVTILSQELGYSEEKIADLLAQGAI
jgi:crotonobetainyl-CoA:carnitine CoA-transferase CaiB-like acyl-CoA transferase